MTDFSNFELDELAQETHWPHEIAGGVIPEMAEVFGVELGVAPDSTQLGQLVGAIGTSKVLQENLSQVQDIIGSDANALEIAADWVERSGVQKPLDRSLWTASLPTPRRTARFVITGGVANWQDRTADRLIDYAVTDNDGTLVLYPVGNREMSTKTEIANDNVKAFHDANGVLPTESKYAEDVIAPRLTRAGYDVTLMPFSTQSGDEIAARFFEVQLLNDIENDQLAFARVANAGIQLATQFRKSMRNYEVAFDADPNRPQTFVLTDTFPIARTAEQVSDPQHYQNPMTAIRQVALTAKLLQEAIEQDNQ